MRFALLSVAAIAAHAQSFEATPNPVRQGQTLRITGAGEGSQARLGERTIRLFASQEGGIRGLMPIPALETPGDYKLDILNKEGAVIQAIDFTIADAHFTTQNIVLTKAVAELTSTPEDVEITKAFRKELIETRYWEEPLGVPLTSCLTSPYGVLRKHNGKLTGDYHAGLDQRGQEGTPIHAVAAGVVKIARPLQLQGGTVGINHGQGLESIYMHMSKVAAIEGAIVKKGDVIGYVGATGRVTGPHLHWSLYANGVPVNPLQWVHLTSCYAAPKAPAKKSTARSTRRKH